MPRARIRERVASSAELAEDARRWREAMGGKAQAARCRHGGCVSAAQPHARYCEGHAALRETYGKSRPPLKAVP